MIGRGTLYVAEEDVGLWRGRAEPDARRDAVASSTRSKDNPALKDDLEGVGLYDLGGGRGYLVVSSQGNNSYAVYRREGDNAYLGSFSVIADAAKRHRRHLRNRRPGSHQRQPRAAVSNTAR